MIQAALYSAEAKLRRLLKDAPKKVILEEEEKGTPNMDPVLAQCVPPMLPSLVVQPWLMPNLTWGQKMMSGAVCDLGEPWYVSSEQFRCPPSVQRLWF